MKLLPPFKPYMILKESQDYEEDLFVSSVQAIGLSGEKTLLIIVDVNRPSYVECQSYWS